MTYQDLEALGGGEGERMEFIRAAVEDHRRSDGYRTARKAERYYAKKNPTIREYQKMVYNTLGQAIPDIWSANYKLETLFFRRFVLQQTQYVLSNGVTFQTKGVKERLGKNFDNALQKLAKKAIVDGAAFGFWNLDHLEVFPFADTPNDPGFAPLYDQDTGLLRAGVRYWETAGRIRRYTLYEADGYTECIQREEGKMASLSGKKPYRSVVTANGLGMAEVEPGEPYPVLPILPMYANDLKESEIVGIQSSIDCYDFIKSGMANSVDETSAFYWILKGCGGMDDTDLAQFVQRMRQLKATVLDRNVEAEAHTLAVPVEANERLLDRLRSDLYEDFMLLDTEKALSGNITATAIRLAYQNQDDKCGDFEYCIREFIGRLLDLLGIQDEPSFQWNRVANQMEETQMVMMAAAELDSEAILNHLPWLTPEEAGKILERRAAEELNKFNAAGDETGAGDTEAGTEEAAAGLRGEE